jgi:hypothetical protein
MAVLLSHTWIGYVLLHANILLSNGILDFGDTSAVKRSTDVSANI